MPTNKNKLPNGLRNKYKIHLGGLRFTGWQAEITVYANGQEHRAEVFVQNNKAIRVIPNDKAGEEYIPEFKRSAEIISERYINHSLQTPEVTAESINEDLTTFTGSLDGNDQDGERDWYD